MLNGKPELKKCIEDFQSELMDTFFKFAVIQSLNGQEMEYENDIRTITKTQFFPAIVKMKTEKWRLVQICASCIEGGYEMSYSFCRGYDMVTLRLEPKDDEEVASITQIYPCAFLQENEAAELFGVKIEHIDPDYGDRLYRIDEATPFKKKE